MPNSRREILKQIGSAGAASGAIALSANSASAQAAEPQSPDQFDIERADASQAEIDTFQKFEQDTAAVEATYTEHVDQLRPDLEELGVSSLPTLEQADSIAVMPKFEAATSDDVLATGDEDTLTPRIVVDFEQEHSFLAIIDPVEGEVSAHVETEDGSFRVDPVNGARKKMGCTYECECGSGPDNGGRGSCATGLTRWRVCRYPDGSVTREWVGTKCSNMSCKTLRLTGVNMCT